MEKIAMKKILIIEDDLISRLAFSITLENYFSVDSASDPDKIIALFRQNSYDFVLMDINLGTDQLDGIQLMKILRQQFPGKTSTFIALTAYAMSGDEERFLENGFDHYLSKPVDFPLLKDFLNSIC